VFVAEADVCSVTSPYLLPSLLTALLGTSNKQFGQYQFITSSVQHRGQRIASHSLQNSRLSRG